MLVKLQDPTGAELYEQLGRTRQLGFWRLSRKLVDTCGELDSDDMACACRYTGEVLDGVSEYRSR